MLFRCAIILLISISLALWSPTNSLAVDVESSSCCSASASACGDPATNSSSQCQCPCCPAVVTKIPVHATLPVVRGLEPDPAIPFARAGDTFCAARCDAPDTPPPRSF